MTAELLLLIASVLSIDGGQAVLDKGLTDGLQPGDRGAIYYELTVAGQPRRVDAGEAELTAVEAGTSRLAVGESGIKPGYCVEFRVPADRIRPPVAPAPTPDVSAETSAAAEEVVAAPEPPPPPRPMLLVPAGSYSIGRDPAETRFFNEQPRHDVVLGAFRIDLDPAERAGDADTPPSWQEADAHCRSLGLRLPTEQEWEVARRMAELPVSRLLEWTASQYLAYPGNTHPEQQYGDRYYTIRGNPPDQEPDPYRRRFATPGTRDTNLGFRCAESARDEGPQ